MTTKANHPEAETNECHIHVFRESPLWDTVEKWFMLPHRDLMSLFVGTYVFDPGEWCQAYYAEQVVKKIREKHPNAMLVY